MSVMQTVIDVADQAGTERLGRKLAALLPRGSVVALNGALGAGKTKLVQAVADACGIDPADVTSPTFVLLQEYLGNPSIFHFDVYRLKDQEEFAQLGPHEYFDGDGLCFVEWADRVTEHLPEEYLEISIEVTGENSRRFTVTAHGESYEPLVDKLNIK
jgi:tRNA threonylcarbamoyladenosine biosynthesis protein TsaE